MVAHPCEAIRFWRCTLGLVYGRHGSRRHGGSRRRSDEDCRTAEHGIPICQLCRTATTYHTCACCGRYCCDQCAHWLSGALDDAVMTGRTCPQCWLGETESSNDPKSSGDPDNDTDGDSSDDGDFYDDDDTYARERRLRSRGMSWPGFVAGSWLRAMTLTQKRGCAPAARRGKRAVEETGRAKRAKRSSSWAKSWLNSNGNDVCFVREAAGAGRRFSARTSRLGRTPPCNLRGLGLGAKDMDRYMLGD
jgi:hypothetical protein